MSGRPASKPEENLKEKLMNIFRRTKPAVPSVPKPAAKDFVINAQILKDISQECPFNNRMRNIREVSELVKHSKLEEWASQAAWTAVSDLVKPHVDIDARHDALRFLLALIEGQLPFFAGPTKACFFRVIDELENPNDLRLRLDLFKALSEDGKNVKELEEETGTFLLKVMPDALAVGLTTEFLQLLINVIKFNAAYIDEEIMSGLVQQTCMIQNRCTDENMLLCLQAMDAVICYSYLPPDALQYFVAALCHVINIPRFAENSWELMHKLLGTHLGHKTIYTLCCMMQDKQHTPDFLMLRGAVFILGTAMWGARRVTSLKHTPVSVLPSLYQVLVHENVLITCEVALSMDRLVKKFGKDLTHVAWETVLNILEILLRQCETLPKVDRGTPANIHDTLSEIERLHQKGHFLGPEERIFIIVETYASKRPAESVCGLIDHQLKKIHSTHDNWIQNLYYLLDKFYRQDPRTEVRKKALEVLDFVISLNKHVYEGELINMVLIPLFSSLDSDHDAEVKRKVVDIVMGVAQGCCNSPYFHKLLDIIEKVLLKPLHVQVCPPQPFSPEEEASPLPAEEQNQEDVKLAFSKMIEAFKHKLYLAPGRLAERLYALIKAHMKDQYSRGYNTATAATMRKAGVELLLQLRSDSKYRVGLVNRTGLTGSSYSTYMFCNDSKIPVEEPASPVSPNLKHDSLYASIDYTFVLEIFLDCLMKETDWPVLKAVLTGLPQVLENKTLVLESKGIVFINIYDRLCSMVKVSNRNAGCVQKLQRVPDGFRMSDLHNYVLPVISAMVAYHPLMDKDRQMDMMKCLEFGLVTGVSKVCVTSLRICCLEMQSQMEKVLASVLISMSKISATVSMAIPVLAFLSSIVRLPRLYAAFNNQEYLSVFAIALPYTNPFKFSHYTVSLAHHVINIWFIRCHLPFRKGFVKYIVRHLNSYVARLLKENKQNRLEHLNQDSSLRGRSGSEGAAFRRRMMSGPAVLRREKTLPMDEKMSQFHQELMETAIDSFSRYTFGNVSSVYKRSAMTSFLLDKGQVETWLVGHKLITITTSGGGVKASGSIFCSKCLELLQQSQQSKMNSMQEKRRRHKSAVYQRSVSEMVPEGFLFGSGGSPGAGGTRHHTRDDLSIVFDKASDDAAVQTGSSLSSGFDIESLGSMLMSWKWQLEDKSVFSSKPCPCWCSGWAEVLIRGPSGNVAWVMRTQNLQCQSGSPGDPSLPDITLLFSPLEAKSPDTDTASKLDSGSLKEEDYDSVHADVFGWDIKSQLSPSDADPEKTTAPEEMLGELTISSPPDQLRKSSSYPSLSPPDDPTPSHMGAMPHDETLFARDRMDSRHFAQDTRVQVRVDSSESRTITSAQNFEGLENDKNKTEEKEEATPVPTLEGMGESEEASEEGQGSFQASLDNPKEHPRTSSKLQAQLQEYDRQKQEDGVKEESGEKSVRLQPPVSLISAPPDARSFLLPQSSCGGDGSGGFRPVHPSAVTGDGLSPRIVCLQSPDSSSSSSITQEDLMEARMKKQRGHTISVMTPAEANRQHEEARSGLGSKDSVGTVTPAELFLQLYHTHPLITDKQDLPLHVPNTETFERSLKMLDNICPYETHNIGVIYVGPGQTRDEKAILSNRYGSSRYIEFIQGLGQMVRLPDPDQEASSYMGALTSADGKFTYTWQDESMRVIFHIATLMPNRKGDPNFNFKKLHIGNDYVTIVYNDSGEDFKLGTLSGQFNYVNIVIRPLDHGGNAVSLLAKQDIADILGHTHPKIISDTYLALLVRQIAVHCNLASFVLKGQSLAHEPFASNCLERLRSIKRIRKRVTDHHNANGATTGKNYGTGGGTGAGSPESYEKLFVIEDFTDFV